MYFFSRNIDAILWNSDYRRMRLPMRLLRGAARAKKWSGHANPLRRTRRTLGVSPADKPSDNTTCEYTQRIMVMAVGKREPGDGRLRSAVWPLCRGRPRFTTNGAHKSAGVNVKRRYSLELAHLADPVSPIRSEVPRSRWDSQWILMWSPCFISPPDARHSELWAPPGVLPSD